MKKDSIVINRLERSTGAKYRTIGDIKLLCDQHSIPYSDSAQCIRQVAPDAAILENFNTNFTLDPLPFITLPEQGASPVLVFEEKLYNNYGDGHLHPSQHGELCTAVAAQVGGSLASAVDSIYIKKSAHPNFLRTVTFDSKADVIKELVENQGVPVINNSIGWQDSLLDYDKSNAEQANHLWKSTAFVVDSAGNNGEFGTNGKTIGAEQKHNAISHFPPLAVHVGAAEMQAGNNNQWVIPAYSSANSPTFVAPVSSTLKTRKDSSGRDIGSSDTSLAAAYTSGALAALNSRYGSYLTREQILYAVLATAKPVEKVVRSEIKDDDGNIVKIFEGQANNLDYKNNSAGLAYNPEYGGFGLIDPHKADHLLCHMVNMAQHNSEGITVPTEQLVTMVNCKKHEHEVSDEKGKKAYQYKVHLSDGIALKTTLEAEFAGEHGNIHITSPFGTTMPMVMSKVRDEQNGQIINKFSMSTSHAWAGEALQGDWVITSTTPLNRLRLNQDHFLANDIVKDLNRNKVDELLAVPAPYNSLVAAVPLVERIPELVRVANERMIPKKGTAVGKYDLANCDDVNLLTQQLIKLPNGFSPHNYSPAFAPPSYYTNSPEGGYESEANRLANSIKRSDVTEHDAIRDAVIRNRLAAVDVYSAQGDESKQIIPLCSAGDHLLHMGSATNSAGKLHSEEAVRHYSKALEISDRMGFVDKSFEIIGSLYKAMSLASEHGKHDEYKPKMAELRKKALDLSTVLHGHDQHWDDDTVLVDKGSYAISNGNKLSAYNQNDSMSIVAKDTINGKVGLLHLADDSSPQLLDDFFKQFDNDSLEIRLVGVKEGGAALEKFQQAIKHRNDNIISADVVTLHDLPRSVVVNPSDFKLEERLPEKCITQVLSSGVASQREGPFRVNNAPFKAAGG